MSLVQLWSMRQKVDWMLTLKTLTVSRSWEETNSITHSDFDHFDTSVTDSSEDKIGITRDL